MPQGKIDQQKPRSLLNLRTLLKCANPSQKGGPEPALHVLRAGRRFVELLWFLAAARGAAAVRALVAASVGGHQHAAFRARRRVVDRNTLARGHFRLRMPDVHHRRISRRFRSSCFCGCRGYLLRCHRSFAIEIIRRNEFAAEPASDVINHRFGVADIRVSGVARRLEPGIHEFIHQCTQWNSILQCDRN